VRCNQPGKPGFVVIAWFLARCRQGARSCGHGSGTGTNTVEDGASPLALDFDGDGTLQQVDGDDQAANLVGVGDDALQPCQRAAFDIHLGAGAQEGPRLRRKPGTENRPNGLDLSLIKRGRGSYRRRRYRSRRAWSGWALSDHSRQTGRIDNRGREGDPVF
jgi:hypothetical protein